MCSDVVVAELEARVGIEPTNAAFAEPCLTTWLPRPRVDTQNKGAPSTCKLIFGRIDARPVFARQSMRMRRAAHARKSGGGAEFGAVFPEVRRVEDADGSDDSGNQIRRGDVEAGVARGARRIGDTDVFVFAFAVCAPRAENFGLVTLFDGNAAPGFQVPINSRKRDGHVEGHSVAFGQDRFGVGANLVGDFARAPQGAIAADDYQVDFAPLEEVSGGIVRNYIVRDALLGEFPRCKRRALATRTCLVAEHVEFLAFGLRGVDRRGGAADIDERQPTGIAMG